jgi:hypothetical protein
MKIYSNTITKRQLEDIAEALDMTLHNADSDFYGPRSRRIALTLRPTADTYRAKSFNFGSEKGRRIWAVSWAGHYVFMRALLDLDPTAKITSGWATYDGLIDFLAEAPETGYRNVGSIAYPLYACDAAVNPIDLSDDEGYEALEAAALHASFIAYLKMPLAA